MNKRALITLSFCLCIGMAAKAQKKDTVAYYMTAKDEVANTIEEATYIRYVYPPIATESLYWVKDFYTSGKPKLVTYAIDSDAGMKNSFDGGFVEYFANGSKKAVGTYHKSKPEGQYIAYYPNGNPYFSEILNGDDVYLKDCRDSTGKLLAKDGNGQWIKFNEDFIQYTQGNILNGKKDGEWTGIAPDSVKYKLTYSKGKFLFGDTYFKTGKTYHYNKIEAEPAFVGGMNAFGSYLSRNIRYPSVAAQNKVTGRVILTFVIERDGSLTEVKVIRGIGSGCDEEAVRVMKNSPNWQPGIQNGVPVRVQYAIPISFDISQPIAPIFKN